MFGSTTGVGSLTVYTEDNSGTQNTIFTVSGNQGDTWLNAEINIPITSGLIVSILISDVIKLRFYA